MPDITRIKSKLEELGIDKNSKIVLYSSLRNTVLAARTYFIFDYLGLGSNVSILDGGLEAWKGIGKPISQEPALIKNRGKLKITSNPKLIVNADWIKEHIKDTTIGILDVRSKMQFDGTTGSEGRTGHIKGAKNVPITSVTDSLARFKSENIIEKLLTDAGIKKDGKLIVYCNIGMAAAIFYVAAKRAGYTMSVYDGSWEDWNERSDDYSVEVTLPTSKAN